MRRRGVGAGPRQHILAKAYLGNLHLTSLVALTDGVALQGLHGGSGSAGIGEGHQAEATALGVAVDGDFGVFVAGQVFKDRSEVAALHGEGQVADVEGQGHVSRRSSFRNDA